MVLDLNPSIVVVSGLPRSGTSLAMQMLHQGGVNVATDGQRVADDDNPRGYYEIEAVKTLQKDASWIPEMRGKAVKVISQLLFALPTTEQYKVLLLRRDIEEVLASQATMLQRSGKAGGGSAEVLRKAFTAHLEKLAAWLPAQQHFQVLELDYSAVVSEPTVAAKKMSDFLGGQLSIEAMAAAVDPQLYRNRHDRGQ